MFQGDLRHFSAHWAIAGLAASQVLAIDLNADSRADLFAARSGGQGQRTFWLNSQTAGGNGNFTAVPQSAVGGAGVDLLPPITHVHANSAVDVDGDCVADLFVTSVATWETWLNLRGGQFVHTADRDYTPRVGAGQVTFADMNQDGTLDMVYPVCARDPRAGVPAGCADDGSSAGIVMVFNMQKPMCGGFAQGGDGDGGGCRASTSLCEADAAWRWGSVADGGEVFVPLGDLLAPGEQMLSVTGEEWGSASAPIATVQVGDVNSDGYADVAIVAVSAATGATRVVLLENREAPAPVAAVAAAAAAASPLATGAQPRWLGPLDATTIDAGLGGGDAGGASIVGVAFFDLADDGMVDVLALTRRNTDGGYAVHALSNGLSSDAFFMKVIVLNGKCMAWCSHGARFPSPKPYGVNAPGVAVKYTISGVDGVKRSTEGMLLSRSGFLSLQTAYVVFGLGRTSNYVDELHVGIAHGIAGEKPRTRLWQSVIPNSQLVVAPYPPEDPASWTLDLFVTPGHLALWVGVVLAVSCVLLSAVVTALHVRERREDEREKLQSAHLFHFDAM